MDSGLRQIDTYSWEGFDRNAKSTFQYEERSRDGSVIELFDASRKLFFTIDLHANLISYTEGHSSLILDAYNITNYNAQAKGFNVNTVDILSFSGDFLGQYMDIGHGSWAETNASGQETFAFKEVNRSEWTVDLYDASRKVFIYLDLHDNVIRYQDPTQAFALYTIGSSYTHDQVIN